MPDMGIWPLLFVALFAGLMGLLELDWSQLFGDPAREALQALVTEIQGWEDLEATVSIWGLGQEPVRARIQAVLRDGAFRVEFLDPPGLVGQVFTYRQGMLVHYRPGNGGLRVVHVLDEDNGLPFPDLEPTGLEVTLEEGEPLGAGWEGFVASPVGLPGFAGAAPPDIGFARSSSPLPFFGFRRLRIAGLPEPLEEVVIWLDEGGKIRGGAVVWRDMRISVRVEELMPNSGLTLLEVLQLPRAARTIWYEGAQSM